METLARDSGLIKWARNVALITALAVAIGTPLGHFYFTYKNEHVQLGAEATMLAKSFTEIVSKDAELWQFKVHRLRSVLSERGNAPQDEVRQLMQADGSLIIQHPDGVKIPGRPQIVVYHNVYDFGRLIGRVVITKSLWPIIHHCIWISLLSGTAGLAIFWFMSVYPLRALQHAWGRISYLASNDALTGLANRTIFVDRLDSAIADEERQTAALTVFCLDLDHFKEVNDMLGHASGDEVLREAARRMRECIRKSDTIARLGGDEFAILQMDASDPGDSASLAGRLISKLSEPFEVDGQDVFIGASVGIALHTPDDPVTAGQLLKNADLALYKSKEKGRGTYTFFREDLDAELRERKSLERDIRQALRESEFSQVYQPQVDTRTNAIVGLEVLARWHHAERGNVPPAIFIPIVERLGLMRQFTEQVLDAACTAGLKWPGVHIAVNISPSLFDRDDLVETVRKVLERTSFPTERLELEITEEVLMSDVSKTLEILDQLRQLGIKISMDDFGKGYSSLSYMRQFRFDKVKIDRSFVTDISGDQGAQAIVRAIVGMCRALDMRVMAEGVETLSEFDVLSQEGCDELQGYFFGRPSPEKQINELLEAPGSPPIGDGRMFAA